MKRLEIDFSAQGNLVDYVAGGFSFGEPNGRWSIGSSSYLVVPAFDCPGSVELRLRLWRPKGSPRRLQILIGAKVVHDTTAAGQTEIAIADAQRFLAPGQDARLTFFHPAEAAAGAAEPMRDDGRALALFFEAIAIRCTAAAAGAVPDAVDDIVQTSSAGFAPTEDIDALLADGADARLRVLAAATIGTPGHLVAGDLLPSELRHEHAQLDAPGDVWVYALGNARVWGNGWIERDGRFLLPPDCFPGYFAPAILEGIDRLPAVWAGALRARAADPLRIAGAVATVMHPNMVYGHFLLEILPRVHLLAVLREWGADIPVLLSKHCPDWVKVFVTAVLGDDSVVWYDHRTQFVLPDRLVLPSMMQTDYALHPAFNTMVATVVRQVARLDVEPRSAYPTHIYLSRTRMAGAPRLLNEPEVEEAMAGLGFTILHPQEMSLPLQMAHYRNARVIAGEFSSALHNAMFMPRRSGVVAINFFNAYQSAIARLRNQTIAFVPPADGVFRHWKSSAERSFAVDCTQLCAITTAVMAEVARQEARHGAR